MAAFEHHGLLPAVELDQATCTILVGEFADTTSPARRDTELVGLDVHLRPGRSTLPLVPSFEYGAVVMAGQAELGGCAVPSGSLGPRVNHQPATLLPPTQTPASSA